MNILQRVLLCSAAVMATGGALSAAYADGDSMETVVVTGVRESLRDALLAKKNAVTITENISTRDIGQLPDVTIAEELNRLPGFNTSLDRGNASQASVRGLGPRYVLGLVNGREVASSEPSQDVRWEIYPSEIVSAAAVSKSQSADLIEGGIAATIDIKTRAPLDYSGPSFTANIAPAFNEKGSALPHYSPWGLRGSASYITHINDTLAFYVAASFQRQKNGYAWFRGWGYNEAASGNAGDITGDGVADSTAWGAQTDISLLQQDRFAVTGAVDWQPLSTLRVKADVLYSDYRIHENQLQQWYNGWGGWTDTVSGTACDSASASLYGCSTSSSSNDSVTIRNGAVVAGSLTGNWGMVNNVFGVYGEQHTLLIGGLNAEYVSGNWDVKVDASHSEAWRHNIWKDIATAVWPENVSYNTARGETPSVSFSGAGASAVSDITAQTAYGNSQMGQVSGPESLSDHISAAQIDATRSFGDSFISAISAGMRLSGREKNHTNHKYYLCPGSGSTLSSSCTGSATLPSEHLETFKVHGVNVPEMIYGDYDKLKSYVYPDGDGYISGSELMGEYWTVHSTNYEGYLKADLATQIYGIEVHGNIGVRIVGTFIKSSGFETSDSGTSYNPLSVSKSYTDALPSFSLNFQLSDEHILRLGGSFAMSRPPLDELRTGYSLSESTSSSGEVTRYGSGGNPRLNPYRSKQLDLSYEWYFHDESLFALATYYKHLSSFIGYNDKYQTINGYSYEIYSPVNGKGGDITGLEATLQTRFYFIPVSFLQDFGIYANYAYVNSNVKEFTPTWNPLDATGLAKHTSEVDLWYSAHGLEARLAYKVTSPYTIAYTWDGSALSSTDWHRNLDASVSYQISDNIGVNFYVSNLTNSVWRSHYDNNPQELARYDMYGRTFSLSLKYHN